MVPTPFGFFEVEQEEFFPHAPQFGEAKLGEAPEALDAVDVVLACHEQTRFRGERCGGVCSRSRAGRRSPASHRYTQWLWKALGL